MENGTSSTALESDSKITTANGHATEVKSEPTHRRSHSGGILSRLSFLRSAGADAAAGGKSPTSPPKKSPPSDARAFAEEPLHHLQGNGNGMEPAMAAALRSHKSRKRKGSLRKTALLSTGRAMFERRASLEHVREPIKSPPLALGDSGLDDTATTTTMPNGHAPDADRDGDYDASTSSSAAASTPTTNDWALPPPSHLKLDTLAHPQPQPNGSATSTQLSPTHHDLLSPDSITSPISRYASTTDDDDGLHLSLGASAADLTRRRSTLRQNPIVASPARGSTSSSPPPHSSSDTEYWGWIILFATWIVFVVGMGSCLGVWSWAWDVGETPYAPPELEDDVTLPIVGYYPALIVCTGVMAWVWCLVAWVGMKYFRHARFDAGGDVVEGD